MSYVWRDGDGCPESGGNVGVDKLVSVTLADGWPTEPSRQSGRWVWPGSLRSALEPQAKVSRLLPGAPWPGLGAQGFRCTAAGGDALLLGSSRCFLTTQLLVGLTPFSPAPRQRLHLRKPAAGYRGLDPGQRPSARPPGACWWPRARATSGQACPVAQIPMLGRSHSPDLPPRHTWNSSPPCWDSSVSQAARARAGCCRT